MSFPITLSGLERCQFVSNVERQITHPKEMHELTCPITRSSGESYTHFLVLPSGAVQLFRIQQDSAYTTLVNCGQYSLHFFNDGFIPKAKFFKERTYSGKGDSYYQPDLAKFTHKKPIFVHQIPEEETDSYTISKQGFAVVNLLEEKVVCQTLEEYKAAEIVGYHPATSSSMKTGIENFLQKWVKKQQEAGNMDTFDYDDSPICVDTVFVVTEPSASAQGAFFGHVDLAEGATIVHYLKQLGDSWLQRLFERNAMIRKQAAAVFAKDLDDCTHGQDLVDDEYLLRCLARDVLDDGRKFWRFVDCQDVLNVWISLVPEGISADTCFNTMGVLDMSTGYNKETDLVEYTACRKQGSQGAEGEGEAPPLLQRQPTFTAYGLKYSQEHRWCTVKHMKYGQAYVWQSPRTPHGAIRNMRGDQKGVRRSIDSRVLFLKWNEDRFNTCECEFACTEKSLGLGKHAPATRG